MLILYVDYEIQLQIYVPCVTLPISVYNIIWYELVNRSHTTFMDLGIVSSESSDMATIH